MNRKLVVGLAAATFCVLSAAPASAHGIEVKHPKSGDVVHSGWVGGDGASHVHGLVRACGALAVNDVVSIYTWWNPENACTHF